MYRSDQCRSDKYHCATLWRAGHVKLNQTPVCVMEQRGTATQRRCPRFRHHGNNGRPYLLKNRQVNPPKDLLKTMKSSMIVKMRRLNPFLLTFVQLAMPIRKVSKKLSSLSPREREQAWRIRRNSRIAPCSRQQDQSQVKPFPGPMAALCTIEANSSHNS